MNDRNNLLCVLHAKPVTDKLDSKRIAEHTKKDLTFNVGGGCLEMCLQKILDSIASCRN